tara:strand:- start:989 stop:1291 length:303 start_codon:yes stop_codon:yes gene_type:complete
MTVKINKNISKKELIENIKSTIGLSSKSLQGIIDYLIDTIIETLVEKKKINIKNFGSFNIYHKKQRDGRNPKTKQIFEISSRNVIKFRASITLKQKVNQI